MTFLWWWLSSRLCIQIMGLSSHVMIMFMVTSNKIREEFCLISIWELSNEIKVSIFGLLVDGWFTPKNFEFSYSLSSFPLINGNLGDRTFYVNVSTLSWPMINSPLQERWYWRNLFERECLTSRGYEFLYLSRLSDSTLFSFIYG